MPSSFPHGVVVFFRQLLPDNSMARSVHLNGRLVVSDGRNENEYCVYDADDKLLGIYLKDYIAAILPLEITGPGNADNSPKAS